MQSGSPLCQPETLFKILFLLPVSEDFAAMLHEVLQEVEGQRAKMAWSRCTSKWISHPLSQQSHKDHTSFSQKPHKKQVLLNTLAFFSPFLCLVSGQTRIYKR